MGWYIALAIVIILLVLLCNWESPTTYDPNKSIIPDMPKQPVRRKKRIPTTMEEALGLPPKCSLKWFVVDRALDNISPAEQLIVNELKKYKVKWHREVAFPGLKINNGYARFDFLVENGNTFFIVEYDGKLAHSTQERKDRDTMKTEFCRDNNIPLTRYNAKHYYHMEECIARLMSKHGIKLK